MTQIKELVKHIRCELDDAEEYAVAGARYMEEDRQLGEMYMQLAREEIQHAHKEHEQAVRLVREYENRGKAVPEAMRAVWDWEHEMMIEHEAKIQNILQAAK